VPFLNPFFDTVPLSVGDWLFTFPLMCLASIAAEITKAYVRHRAAAMVGAALH